MPVQQLHHHTHSAGCVTTLCKSFQKSECVIMGSVKCYKEMHYICWGPSHLRSSVRLTLNLLAPTTVGARINP